MSSPWQPDDVVEARYQAKKYALSQTMWYPGVVQRVAQFGGSWFFDIAYDDGDIENDVPEKFIRAPREAIVPEEKTRANTAIPPLHVNYDADAPGAAPATAAAAPATSAASSK